MMSYTYKLSGLVLPMSRHRVSGAFLSLTRSIAPSDLSLEPRLAAEWWKQQQNVWRSNLNADTKPKLLSPNLGKHRPGAVDQLDDSAVPVGIPSGSSSEESLPPALKMYFVFLRPVGLAGRRSLAPPFKGLTVTYLLGTGTAPWIQRS